MVDGGEGQGGATGGSTGGKAGEGGGAAGGATGGQANPGTSGAGGAGHVSREDHERALADMHKYKTEAKKLADEKALGETNKMKEQNQWKELAEKREQEAKDALIKSERLEKSYLGEKKYSAVHAKCLALGLRPEAISDLEMLDLEDVNIETTSTGKINVLGADKFAERLKTRKPHWFDKPKPVVNGGGNRVHDSSSGEKVTVQQVIDAEKEGRKSGDLTKYHALHKQFQQQRFAK